jgi:hypothetical protein
MEEYRAYDGEHVWRLWRQHSDRWQCPGCGRTKFQIMRWTVKDRGLPTVRTGWKAVLHVHHDHQADPWIINPQPRVRPRFFPTVICDHCNGVDVAVKQRYPQIDRDFSFTPWEIRQIVLPRPHQGHRFDYLKALMLYMAAQERTRLRA